MAETEPLVRGTPGEARTKAAREAEGRAFYAPLRAGLGRSLHGIEDRLRDLREPHSERVSLLAARNLLRAARNCLVRAEQVSRRKAE